MRGFRCQERVRSGTLGFDANHLRWCRLIKPWFTSFNKNKKWVATLLALTTVSHQQTQEPLKGLRLEISLQKSGQQREDFASLGGEDIDLLWRTAPRRMPARSVGPAPGKRRCSSYPCPRDPMSIKVGTYPSGSGVAMPPANPGKSII